ncbi:MAG: ABC transporter ATP-binding protein [Pseudomonadota bacterium]
MPAPAPMIELNQASYLVDGRALLSDISFRVDARRIGIIGRNGSGKTTLARMMAGLVPPTSGLVRVDGVDVSRDRKAALRKVGILFQNPDHQIIFPTVEEELGFGLRQMGRSAEEVTQEVIKVLDRFDRRDWFKAALHQLSQGQRQLVCLMAVLAMRPDVILLDEPFSGLDIPTAMRLARIFDGVEATLVQITHDPTVLRSYDRLIWIDAGRVVMEGEVAQVLPAFQGRMAALGATDDLADLAG